MTRCVSFSFSTFSAAISAACCDQRLQLLCRGGAIHRILESKPTYLVQNNLRPSTTSPRYPTDGQPTLRYCRAGCRRTASISMPSSNQCNCSVDSLTTACCCPRGQAKRSASSRFIISQNPERSYNKSRIRSRRRLQKANTARPNGYVACHITVHMCRARLCGGVTTGRLIPGLCAGSAAT
jgi:hypothetical protein